MPPFFSFSVDAANVDRRNLRLRCRRYRPIPIGDGNSKTSDGRKRTGAHDRVKIATRRVMSEHSETVEGEGGRGGGAGERERPLRSDRE